MKSSRKKKNKIAKLVDDWIKMTLHTIFTVWNLSISKNCKIQFPNNQTNERGKCEENVCFNEVKK